MNSQELRQEPVKKTYRRGEKETLTITPAMIRGFLKEKEAANRSAETLTTYRRNLQFFTDFLGGACTAGEDSLKQWREAMRQEGYSSGTVTSRISTINSFFDYIGKRDWQVFDGKRPETMEKTELTREEYLNLLREARKQENIQAYLLIKVMGTTDLTPGDMPLLTREAVNGGVVTGKRKKTEAPLELPEALRLELLEYARQRGIRSGPIFLNARGKCHDRIAINRFVRQIGEEAGIEFSKSNPRNLRRLHLTTLAGLQKQADAWVTAQYRSLLEEEEHAVGWCD